MKALILFSHGSLLCGAGIALEAHAERLRKSGEFHIVEIGYLNYSSPTFAEAVERCYDAGAHTIVVSPYFLVPGYFVSKKLPECIDTVRAVHSDIEFIVADAIGFHPLLADILIESAENPLPPEDWRIDLSDAAQYCRINPECPLFHTISCPMSPSYIAPELVDAGEVY